MYARKRNISTSVYRQDSRLLSLSTCTSGMFLVFFSVQHGYRRLDWDYQPELPGESY
jgi:hypothetical protein